MKDKAGHVQLLPSAQVQLKGNDSGRAANQPRAFADKKKNSGWDGRNTWGRPMLFFIYLNHKIFTVILHLAACN